MSVHQLKDGRWFVQYRIDGKIKREYYGRGTIAEREARERNSSLAIMRHLKTEPDSSPTFLELAEGYLKGRMASMESSSLSVLQYKLDASLLPEFGHIESMKITKERIDQYVIKRLAQGKKSTTVRRDIADIQAIMYFAVERKLIPHNPIAGYKKPRKDTEIFAPPTISEMIEIDKHAPDHLRRALKIIYFTGCRPGQETLNLKWSNISWEQNTIRIVSAKKHGAPYRDVPIYKDFRAFLEKWYEEDKKQQEKHKEDKKRRYIHIVNYRGRAIKSIKTSWRRAKLKAKIARPIIPYSYRHAFATWLLDNGADLKSVSELLGHSTPALTLAVYKHTSMASHRRAIDKLPAVNW